MASRTAVVTVFGEELAQLGVNEWAALAEELLAEFEQLGGDLFGRNAELDVGIGGIGCVGGLELEVHTDPFRGLVDQVVARAARAWARR
ncbi:MAG: hypothetical protein QOE41_4479 [Mycobacterium sp.]|jgi:hypothetical protein|nr:hypothetical protein [Mycobacterium sp.]MDT5135168.1 hypothetical protein [Mycobacterium sp.]